MNEHSVDESGSGESVNFRLYEGELHDLDSQSIKNVLDDIIKLQDQIDTGQEIDPTRLDKIIVKAMTTKLLMEPIEVSGKLRLADGTFDDADYIPEELEDITRLHDKFGEYLPLINQTIVFDSIDIVSDKIVLSARSIDDFYDDIVYEDKIIMHPQDIFEHSPTDPSIESTKMANKEHYRAICETIPKPVEGYDETLIGLQEYSIDPSLDGVDVQDIARLLYERCRFDDSLEYKLHIDGPMYSRNFRGESTMVNYQGELNSARIMAISLRASDTDDKSRFYPELVLAVKHPEDPDAYMVLVVPVGCVKSVDEVQPENYGFDETLISFDDPYMAAEEFFAEVDGTNKTVIEDHQSKVLEKLAERGLASLQYSTEPIRQIDLCDDIDKIWHTYLLATEKNPDISRADCRNIVKNIDVASLKDLRAGDRVEAELCGRVEINDDGSLTFIDDETINSYIRGNFCALTDVFDSHLKSYSLGMYIEDSGVVLRDNSETKSSLEQGFIIPMEYCVSMKKLVSLSQHF